MAAYIHDSGGVTIAEGPGCITVSDSPTRIRGAPVYTTVVQPSFVKEAVTTRSYSEPGYYSAEPLRQATYIDPVTRTVVGEAVTHYTDHGLVERGAPVVVAAPLYSERAYTEPIQVVRSPTVLHREVVRGSPAVYHHPLGSARSVELSAMRSPTQVGTVTHLLTEAENNNSDWVVAERVPRSIVRHNMVDQSGGLRDGRYIIGENDFSDGLLRLPDGRIKYADGTIQPAPAAAFTSMQGSIVSLSDGSVLLPDGTIEYPDGTIRRPTAMSHGALDNIWDQVKNNNSKNLTTLTEQISQLKEEMRQEEKRSRDALESIRKEKDSETLELKAKLHELVTERRIYEKELQVLQQGDPTAWMSAVERLRSEMMHLQEGSASPHFRESLAAKEEHLRRLHEQFLAEARANSEARGLLQALQEERAREAETRKLIISEAVLRKEQEIVHEKDRLVSLLQERHAAEKEQLIAEERAHAERMLETEIANERARTQADLQAVADELEAERQKLEYANQSANDAVMRAVDLEQELAALKMASPEKKKKKKKKKGKKRAKKAAPKPWAPGVIGGGRLAPRVPVFAAKAKASKARAAKARAK